MQPCDFTQHDAQINADALLKDAKWIQVPYCNHTLPPYSNSKPPIRRTDRTTHCFDPTQQLPPISSWAIGGKILGRVRLESWRCRLATTRRFGVRPAEFDCSTYHSFSQDIRCNGGPVLRRCTIQRRICAPSSPISVHSCRCHTFGALPIYSPWPR